MHRFNMKPEHCQRKSVSVYGFGNSNFGLDPFESFTLSGEDQVATGGPDERVWGRMFRAAGKSSNAVTRPAMPRKEWRRMRLSASLGKPLTEVQLNCPW